ncbi:MAG: TetR/AcrR family transcriptional regulator [Acidobacteriota bacterium]|nr:TetR/AcrR family transcriptional regulator [Acidobacteriota bacterium]
MTAHSKSAAPVKVPRGRPPIADAVKYRKRILDATAAVFLEKGFERASTNEIARRAQTSKQTLYSLYPSKAELFVGVVTARIEPLFARHVNYIESAEPPRKVLSNMGESMLRMFRSREFLALYRILVSQVHTFPEPALALWRSCAERGYALLAEYLAVRKLGGPDYEKSSVRFVSFVLEDFLFNALLDPALHMTEKDLRRRVDEAVDDFMRLHAPAERKRLR